MLVAFHENSARAICAAIEELHELRAEVERLRGERAAVVRYMSEGGYVCTECKDIAVSELATGIVRGEHRKEAP